MSNAVITQSMAISDSAVRVSNPPSATPQVSRPVEQVVARGFMKTLAWLLMLTMLLAGSVFAGELKGKVIRVADGDTLTILIEPIKLDMPVRLSGIDAPEKGMPFGQVSKTSLSDLAFGKLATVIWGKKDKYGRIVGKVLIDGQDVNLEQVNRGLAWHFKEYQDEQSVEEREAYAKAEIAASARHLGLWQDKDPVPPWAWRKAKRASGQDVVVEESVK